MEKFAYTVLGIIITLFSNYIIEKFKSNFSIKKYNFERIYEEITIIKKEIYGLSIGMVTDDLYKVSDLNQKFNNQNSYLTYLAIYEEKKDLIKFKKEMKLKILEEGCILYNKNKILSQFKDIFIYEIIKTKESLKENKRLDSYENIFICATKWEKESKSKKYKSIKKP